MIVQVRKHFDKTLVVGLFTFYNGETVGYETAESACISLLQRSLNVGRLMSHITGYNSPNYTAGILIKVYLDCKYTRLTVSSTCVSLGNDAKCFIHIAVKV